MDTYRKELSEDLCTIVNDLQKKKLTASTEAVAPKGEADTRVSQSPQRTQFMTKDSTIPGRYPKVDTQCTKLSPDC
jgi:hypothetical protein